MKAYLIIGVVCFAAGVTTGWTANGWRLNNEINIVKAEVNAEAERSHKLAIQRLQVAHQEALARKDARAQQLKDIAIEANLRSDGIQRESAAIEARYREALKDPTCEEFSRLSLACPVELRPLFSAQ